MSQIRITSKPTLGGLLDNPQGEQIRQYSQQKVIFPKINTKLKKTHFIKYRSAFINSQTCDIDSEHQFNQQSYNRSSIKKLNTEAVHEQKLSDLKLKSQLKQGLWKVNKNHNQSYSIKSTTQRLNQSQQKLQKIEPYTQRKDKLIESNVSQIKKNERFALLNQIRQLNISPIQHVQTCRYQRQNLRKNCQINQKIEKSNKIISLIQKNYHKGFFQNSSNKDSSLQKLQEKLGLFSYLKRGFVTKKQKLTSQKLKQYFKSPSNQKLQAKINFQARSFLKQKLHSDYRSYREVNTLKDNLSKDAISSQIKQKNVQFRQQYNKKYNIPYLSFLSLPKNLKIKVLENLTHQTSKTFRK